MRTSIIGALAAIVITTTSVGQVPCPVTETTRTGPQMPQFFDEFGFAVAFDDATLVVGSPGHWEGAGIGEAHVYSRSGAEWVFTQRIAATDNLQTQDFGWSVGVDGSVLAVGSPNTSSGGRAYVFRQSAGAWQQEAVLMPAVSSGADFGHSIAVSGNRIAVGAWLSDEFGSESGSVYVYAHDGSDWNLEQMLTASNAASRNYFGSAVSLDGSALAVGAYFRNVATGAAYIFRHNGVAWNEEQAILHSGSSDEFGWSLSLDGDRLLVGLPRDTGNNLLSGTAQIFRFDSPTWVLEQTLIPAAAEIGERFGHSVSLSGNVAVIGANFGRNGPLYNAGWAGIYRKVGNQWFEHARLDASDADDSDALGFAVATNGAAAVIGAPEAADGEGRGSGLIYFVEGLDDCDGNGYSDICDIAAGRAADADGNGIPDQCDSPSCICERTGDNPASIDVFDLLTYLDLWFAGDQQAELTGDDPATVDVFDLLAFLDCWFAPPCT